MVVKKNISLKTGMNFVYFPNVVKVLELLHALFTHLQAKYIEKYFIICPIILTILHFGSHL